MLPAHCAYKIGQIRAQESHAEAERWRRASQSEPPRHEAIQSPYPAIFRTARYARYIVTALAALAFGLTTN